MARTKKVINMDVSNTIIKSSEQISEQSQINIESVDKPIKQKRGRKSKKDIAAAASANISNLDNIICTIEDNLNLNNNHNESNQIKESTIKNLTNEVINTNINSVIGVNINIVDDNLADDIEPDKNSDKPVAKKRGRKPKGGKIIQQITPLNNNKESKQNVILHLKCSLKDLQTNFFDSTSIESFNFTSNKGELSYEIIGTTDIQSINNQYSDDNNNSKANYYNDNEDSEYEENTNKNCEIKEIWKKLKQLEHNLHVNNVSDKKSACFWCTHDFDNPPIYIPKHYIKDSYQVYGCFCSPECATAHLMNENIDSSSKFERYYLINHIYSKIYGYSKNIKPAPNPYYMLEKYYGNLNIQEYRSLLRNERLFLVVDKPLTRVLPELHEDNDDFIITNKIIPSNTYQIKKKLQKKPLSKNNILNEKFGLAH